MNTKISVSQTQLNAAIKILQQPAYQFSHRYGRLPGNTRILGNLQKALYQVCVGDSSLFNQDELDQFTFAFDALKFPKEFCNICFRHMLFVNCDLSRCDFSGGISAHVEAGAGCKLPSDGRSLVCVFNSTQQQHATIIAGSHPITDYFQAVKRVAEDGAHHAARGNDERPARFVRVG